MPLDDPSPQIPYREVLLHKIKLSATAVLSPAVLRHARISREEDYVVQRLIYQLDSYVHAEKADKTFVFVEDVSYPSWKHHLLAALPVHSFRRRFLERLWDMVDEPLGKVVTHTVTTHAYRAFPEDTHDYPEHLGNPVVFAVIDDNPYTCDYRGRDDAD